MKLKVLLVAALALALGVWLGFHHVPARPKAGPLVLAPKPAVQAASFRTTPAKMVTIAGLPQPGAASRDNPPLSTPWESIQTIVDDQVPYAERLEAMRRLPAKLTEADWLALKKFLLQRSPLDQEQLRQVLKNELMNRLCAMEPPPAGVGDVLVALYKDETQPLVLRDYAIQHLAAYLEQAGGSTGPGLDREHQQAWQVLWAALQQSDGSLAGTALLGLKRLFEAGADLERGRLEQAATQLAGNPAASELTRISACQVCAQLGLQEALPAIEAAARSSSSVAMQISAVGALGLLGGTNDLALLQSLLPGGEPRLRLPVQAAIDRIRRRSGQFSPATGQPQLNPFNPI